jgi:hypothetical protein
MFVSEQYYAGTTEIENSMLPIAFHVSPDYSGELTPIICHTG